MNLTNLTAIKQLCRQHNIKPRRGRGQNFLIDKNVLNQFIQTADLKPTDTVLEVGAGFGAITQELVKSAGRVIAVELDNNLIPILRQNTFNAKNIILVSGDILRLNLKEYLPPEALAKGGGIKNNEYRIVANLPYNITSRFIRNMVGADIPVRTINRHHYLGAHKNGRTSDSYMLIQPPRPQDMTLIIQREVAERICAKPGEDMSLLSVSVQFYAKPQIVEYIKPESFWPKPDVESAIIKISNVKTRTDVNVRDFFRIARIGFSSRRKMLKNNLSAGLKVGASEIQKILASVGLNSKARPQDLSVDDWVKLSRNPEIKKTMNQ